jgi:serine/threonine protein phosphatase PrpC
MVAARRRRTFRHDALRISGAGETHLGHVRMENQDVILVEPQLGLYAVLDGMGGHPAGDVAARVGGHAIAISVRQRGRMRRRWPRQVLERALRIAASEVFRAGEERPEYHYMGTTVVACLVAPTRAVIGHIGDSRAYLLRDGELAALTRDHSVVQQLLDAGEITPRQAKRHPERQRLTANLGRGGWVLPEMTELRLREGDRLLLCSDGLHGYAPASAIRRVLAGRGGAEKIARRLVELALRCMTPDNVSAVVIAVEGGAGEGGGRRRQVVRRGGIGAVGRRRVRR